MAAEENTDKPKSALTALLAAIPNTTNVEIQECSEADNQSAPGEAATKNPSLATVATLEGQTREELFDRAVGSPSATKVFCLHQAAAQQTNPTETERGKL